MTRTINLNKSTMDNPPPYFFMYAYYRRKRQLCLHYVWLRFVIVALPELFY